LGADEVELSPSRGSYTDPVEYSTSLNEVRTRTSLVSFHFEDFVDPKEFNQWEPVVSASPREPRQDPDEFVGYEDYGQYGNLMPANTRKTHSRKKMCVKIDGQYRRPKPAIDYKERIQRLVKCMPHLEQLQTFSSRTPSGGSIIRLEYGKDLERPRHKFRKTFDSTTWTGSASDSLAQELAPKRDTPCCLRALLVEDLTTDLMRVLGSQYEIDPEAFAVHISMSGHDKLSYTELSESRWSTAKTKKSYRSIKWHRPVRLESRVLSWLQNPEDVVKLEGEGIEWSEVSYERRGNVLVEKKTKHHMKLNTNIFRQARPLSTRPLDFSKDSVSAVWEERATVFLSTEKGLPTSESLSFDIIDRKRQTSQS
jgi:hypothetical protein